MDHREIEKYIDTYVKNLLPFKDKGVYQSLVSILRNYFLKYSYTEIPYALKDFVENQIIDQELYNSLLIGVGYPTKLIDSLRTTQKKILVNSLMDYNRYVSTTQYIEKLCDAFQDGFNIYELYADFRLYRSETGVVRRDWVMIPNPIYMEKEKELLPYNYGEIYNGTPTYYVSKQHLEMLRHSGSLTLPFKTNLIVLDMLKLTDESEINQLISLTTLFYFKDYYFTLYFETNSTDITIANAYRLWFYLIYYYIGEVNSTQLNNAEVIFYNLNANTFPYTLDSGSSDNIELIKNEYDQLLYQRYEVDNFHNKYFSDEFKRQLSTQSYTLEDLRRQLIIVVGIDAIVALENIIDSSEDRTEGVLGALGLINDSLQTYINNSEEPLLKQYETYLYNIFPSLLLDPTKTATYKILMEFKPYHTQLIAFAKYGVSYKSKINNAFIDDTSRFVVHDWPTSSLVISDSFSISKSIETGWFVFDTSDVVMTDRAGAMELVVGDKIYSRDITTNEFPTDTAEVIVDIYSITGDQFGIKLENEYTGLTGTFPRAYKFNAPPTNELIEISGAYFSFTTIGNANEVDTNESGFMRFNIGDYIYAPVDDKRYATLIIDKNYNTMSFILEHDYTGSDGTWPNAYLLRTF